MDFSACLDCLCPCLKSYSSSNHQYEQVSTTSKDIPFSETTRSAPVKAPAPSTEVIPKPSASVEKKKDPPRDIARVHKPENQAPTNSIYYDQNLAPFTGCEVLQKFNNNTAYNKRFVWLNSQSRTIHMSQHMTKERRHKEASLSDVTSVVAGPPAKKKAEAVENVSDMCLTVNFKRGGGIDLQFKTKEDRDVWYNTLLHIVSEFDH
mmetsp:Transcript_17896/g.29928  ORF Transcript_17896/g.29928 Transcript_17896/m.29928 type:complete len:206 (+) Transcript_17896:87-704(+)